MAEKICAKVGENQGEQIKAILRGVRDRNPGLEINSLRFGKLGDETIVSFNVDDRHHRLVINALINKNFRIVPLTENTKKIVDEVKPQSSPPKPVKSPDWKEIKKNNSNSGHGNDPLDKAVEMGDYKKVIEISKDIRNSSELVKKANKSISEAVDKAVEKAVKKSKKNKYDREEAVDHLIEIASDQVLRALSKIDAMKHAGTAAIEICSNHQELYWQLVKICNNNGMPYHLIMQSAIKLSNLLLGDAEVLEEDREYAVKNLNIRWLNVSFDIIGYEFSEEDQKKFNELVDYVKENKT